MRRLLVLLFLFAFFASTASAQPTPLDQAEADYRFQFDLYRTAYQQYQVDKAEYLKSGTLKAEQEALESAKAASLARADVLRTYTQWLRLQLLALAEGYPRAGELASRLELLNQWYLDHKVKINAAGTKTVFEQVQQEYIDGLETREKLYLQSQIELKLARLMAFRLELMRLYQPLQIKLATQVSIPEVEQGMVRSEENFATIETRIKALSETVKVLEVTEARRATEETGTIRRNASRELESLKDLTLTTINILSELEVRYGR